MVHQCTRSIVIGSFFKKGTLPLIEIPFQIGSPPNDERGAGLISMIVQLYIVIFAHEY